MVQEFRYILRYLIDPAFAAEERMAELVDFCRRGQIREVMLFQMAEELSPGHPTRKELQPYVELAVQLKALLAKEGIDLSLNPWTTTYHIARGRTLRSGQDFTLMVGENGAENPIAACPLCPHWQAWLCESFAYLAREVQPIAIWVEDDWRLHNHNRELGWGGCFCRLHMERFSQAVGREVTREELLQRILAPGQPDPRRTIWLELSRKTLLEPAEKLRQAVHEACPQTRLGLMSSEPDVHSIEGRNWPALQKALGDTPAFLTRPHMPPYTETTAMTAGPAITRHTIANLIGPLEVYPELENDPRTGAYSKSGSFSIWQCLHAAAMGSNGITINHYDMMGNGISLDERFGKFLAEAKSQLDALRELQLDDRNAHGVRVLFSPRIAEYVHTDDGRSMASLHGHSLVWAKTMGILGIAYRMTSEPQHGPTPLAVCGQTLRSYSDEELKSLFQGPVLMDALSAEVLLERGLGQYAGLAGGHWKTLLEDPFAYESINSDDAAKYGLAQPRMTAQRCAERILHMETLEGCKVTSWLHGPGHAQLCAGSFLYENLLGGKVFTLAYPLDNGSQAHLLDGGAQFFMGFFSAFRRIFLQDMLLRLSEGGGEFACVANHPMQLYWGQGRKHQLLAVLNASNDLAPKVVFQIRKRQIDPKRLEFLDRQGRWNPAPARVQPCGEVLRIEIDHDVPPLQGFFLRYPG